MSRRVLEQSPLAEDFHYVLSSRISIDENDKDDREKYS